MTMIDDAGLIEKIDAFCQRHSMKPTRFGREALGEASLISTLRDGRSLSLKTANRVIAFMADFDVSHVLGDTSERPRLETGNPDEVSTYPAEAA